MQRAEAVVIDDLGDRDFVGAGDGLRELVVIDKHKAGLHGLEDIALGEDAGERTFIARHEDGVVGEGEFFAHVGDAFIGVDGDELAIDHALDAGGRADEPRGGGGVVRAHDDADAAVLRERHGLLVDFEIAGDDERADAELDGAALHVATVADDDDRLAGGNLLALGDAPKGLDVHRAEADEEVLDLLLVDEMDGAALEGAGDVGERGVDLPHEPGLADARDEHPAELRHGDRAHGLAAGIGDRKDSDVMPVDELDGFGAGGALGHGDDGGRHEIVHARRHVAQVLGERLLEAGEDGVDAGIGITAAGSDVAALAPRLLVRGIGDRGADRIGVGIFVTHYIGRLGTGRAGRGRSSGRHHWVGGRWTATSGGGSGKKKSPVAFTTGLGDRRCVMRGD